MKKLVRFSVPFISSAAVVALSSNALACGGFFCSQAQPVNQAAERIVFANDGDGTVTAVIQIMYEGPSEHFSWLLPLSSVPDDVLVSSDIAFQRLQAATNPNYSLTTTVEGECKTDAIDLNGDGIVDGYDTNGDGVIDAPPTATGVSVEASGVVGSFEWTVISVDPALDAPSDAAVNWLEDNGYDVTDQGAELIAPYMDEGMNLLALKLVKGADTGSIRPIVLKYEADEPMIPIQLTAVAANDDMGVMSWLLSDKRAVPKNYLSLELNEAQIDWFNSASNYNDVVISAAKEAGGQGFVTEFAGSSDSLGQAVWSSSDEDTWQRINEQVYSSFSDLFNTLYGQYFGFDGFWDAARAAITLPADVSFEDFQTCPGCYSDQIEFSPTEYLAAMEEHVIQPVRLMQDLLDEHPYTTRLYTTMSARDMTLDPVFTENGDLGDVSNVHVAQRIIECSPDVYEYEAPWRIELPQGGVIRGTAADAASLTWPKAVADQPANFTVSQLSASGDGQILVDNADDIGQKLDDYNATVPPPTGSASGGSGGSSSTGSGGSSQSSAGANGAPEDTMTTRSGGGCSLSSRAPSRPIAWWPALLGLSALSRRRRRRARAR